MQNVKRKLAAATAGVGIAPFIAIAGPAGPASAHGYVAEPPSRQAQCARNWLECGEIKWEPQSVEGPKGLRSCSGGNARFAELDDDSKPWRVTTVGRTATFTWTFTARHRTRDYEYYIGGTRVGWFDGGDTQPPETVQHTVNLGTSGRQKVLAVWNIADTAMAFYACSDLQIS